MSPLNTEAVYEFRVERHLGTAVAAHFPEMTLRHLPDGSTLLYGALPDQSALHGLLTRIRDLGLTLLSVRRVEE
jgi:hypothetical protein